MLFLFVKLQGLWAANGNIFIFLFVCLFVSGHFKNAVRQRLKLTSTTKPAGDWAQKATTVPHDKNLGNEVTEESGCTVSPAPKPGDTSCRLLAGLDASRLNPGLQAVHLPAGRLASTQDEVSLSQQTSSCLMKLLPLTMTRNATAYVPCLKKIWKAHFQQGNY